MVDDLDPSLRAELLNDEYPWLKDEAVREQLIKVAQDFNRVLQKERARADELQRTLAELEESYLATIQAMAFIVEARDTNTHFHLNRAHDYAVALAERISPDIADDRIFRYGFLLHDIGKVGVRDHILSKPSPLTDTEWEVMKTHPIIGATILQQIPFLRPAIPIVEAHHEQWDGSGYPRGLKGNEIPVPARIFSVVDTFDAMTSDRPYRRAMSVEAALEEILKAAGTQFDPEVAAAFVALCKERTNVWPLPEDHSIEGLEKLPDDHLG
ncbi:MAG: HD-GYP domain-containing protein [Actinomycetota bacterium]